MDSRYLTSFQKNKILKRDGYQCRYCGTFDLPFEFDHVYPHSKGGETSLDNIVTACKSCNRKKYNLIGVWPKPIGYFNKPRPSFLSYFLAVLSILLLSFGVFIYQVDAPWGFWTIISGTLVGFICVHIKKLGNKSHE